MTQSIEFSVEESGPLPSPRVLNGYEQTLPGAAERIFKHFEDEQSHRHASQNKRQTHIERLERRGQSLFVFLEALGMVFGFIVCLVIIYIGYLLVVNNHDAMGFALIVANMAALVASFVYRQRAKARAAERRGESE